MSARLLVSVSWGDGQPIVTLQEMADSKSVSYLASWPVTFLEACDWATWATWARHSVGARLTPMSTGWILSLPCDTMPTIDYRGVRYHDSHRRRTYTWVSYRNLVGDGGYRLCDTPYSF